MPRRPKNISDAQQATIERMAKAGRSAADIAAATGLSPRTASRRAAAVIGTRRARPKTKAAPKKAASPAVAPAAPPPKKKGRKKAEESFDPIADIDALIDELQAMVTDAQDAGNLATQAAAQRLRLQALGLREKLRPTPPPDVEAFPDMQRAASECRDKLREMMAQAAEAARKGAA